jgi:DNA-binding GntR family transcriptional regulator
MAYASTTHTGPGDVPAAQAKPVGSRIERPAPLREAVFDALVEMIIAQELQPGEHLVEKELAASLGVSRQPLREALQRMHTEGWVDLRPALGAFVHIPTEAEADQLLAARSILEAESAKLGAEQATAEQVEHLRELQRIGEEALAVDDQQVLLSANASLHTYIVEMSGNKVLMDLRGSVEHRVRWYYKPIAQVRSRDAWEEHAELIQAIASRDGARACALMRMHTERTRVIYREQRRREAAEANDEPSP